MGGKHSKVTLLAKVARRAETRQGKMVVATRCHYLPRRIEDDYEPLSEAVLGTGSTATVRLWRHRATGFEVAVKSFEFSGLDSEAKKSLASECEILLSVDHPNVCRTLDVYETEAALHLVMEKTGGGDLCSRIEQGPVDEATAMELTRQALSALAYLHSNGIAHRDVKLENMLYDPQGDGHVQLIDFGLSDLAGGDVGFEGYVGGSLPYAAPEIFKGNPCYKSDIWSLGVCVFAMLAGTLPFTEESSDELAIAVSSGRITSTAAWAKLSVGAKAFVSELLSVSIGKRPSAREALRHSWLQHPCDALDPSVLRAMVEFAEVSPMRRACLLATAWSVPSSDCAEARKAFAQLDRARRGVISAEDLGAVILRNSPLRTLEALDQSGNGRVHYAEFLAALLAADIVPLRDEAINMTFLRVGRDGLMSLGLEAPFSDNTRDFTLFLFDEANMESIEGVDHKSFSSFEHQSLSELPEFEPKKPGAALHRQADKASAKASAPPRDTFFAYPDLLTPLPPDCFDAGLIFGAPILGL